MTVKKSATKSHISSSWQCFGLGCYGEQPKIRPKKALPPNRTTSFQRLSQLDLSTNTLLSEDLSNSLAASNTHMFTLQELKVITQGFSTSNFLGEGGFGPVHKGFIDDKLKPGLKAQSVAVKILDLDGSQGHKEWLNEVIYLGQLRHENLVKLIGYCIEDEHRVLVYEYMPRGSLENQLFRRYSVTLPWATRMKIAYGAAKGLEFLHEAEQPIIYRDFKASNILLDSEYNAKLSDFGLAKDGPEGDDTHVSTRVMGTHGYAAPEYIMTGHLTAASDVYSFGVVLLELLTGRRSSDKSRPKREQNLVDWARPMLKDPRKLSRIMDPRLEGMYSEEGAQAAACLAYHCLSHRPKHRPTMSTVVKTLDPLKDYKDLSSVGTFVYTVTSSPSPSPSTPSQSPSPEGKRDGNGRKHHNYHEKHRLHPQRQHQHRSPTPKSPAVHSENVLNGSVSPRPNKHAYSKTN